MVASEDSPADIDRGRLGSALFSLDGRDVGSESAMIASDDWRYGPSLRLTENDRILVWWLPEYDKAVSQVVAEYQWAWQIPLLSHMETLIPESVLRAWRDSDPLCREYSWVNVLLAFAWGRARQLGISSRPPMRKVCACCSREFLESDLSFRAISRLGVDALDICEMCLRQAFYANGSPAATSEGVVAVLQALSGVLQRPPKNSDLNGRLNLRDLPRDARATAVQALRVKPTLARVKELFGSWEAAIAEATVASPVPLPRYDNATPARSADSEFTRSDPAYYRSLTGPLPEIVLDSSREELTYYEEITSLIGTGYLALAEAALNKLREQDCVMNFTGLLAQIYGQTARKEEARAATETAYNGASADDKERYFASVLRPRDVRTITSGPFFYRPLPSLPRGYVRFVLVGGPMDYVDRRGVHTCVSGESPPGGAEVERAESVARMSAMVDGAPWMQAATEAGQAIMTSLSRTEVTAGLYGHQLSYVTSPFRQIVKALTRSLPARLEWQGLVQLQALGCQRI